MSTNKYFLTDIEDVYTILDSKVGKEVSAFIREHMTKVEKSTGDKVQELRNQLFHVDNIIGRALPKLESLSKLIASDNEVEHKLLKSVIDELRDSIDAELLYDGYYD